MPVMENSDDNRADRVFYVSSHGLAGDHWFDWFAKALNAHPEIMTYMGETVRSKYLKERSRKERPDPLAFTHFLADLGSAYTAIGECYAYRAYQLELLWKHYGDAVRFVNLVRHPYCWLGYYVDWRCANMNMPSDNTEGVEHEWHVTCHEEIGRLGLRPYSRADIHVWASYQGMLILNRMISDRHPEVVNIPLEQVVASRERFQEVVSFLTHGRVTFPAELLDHVYGWVHTPFRAGGVLRSRPEEEYRTWPDWKKEAFTRIVNKETITMFQEYGYVL